MQNYLKCQRKLNRSFRKDTEVTKSSKFQMLREDSNMPIATLSMYPNMLANKRKGLLLMARLYKMFNMGNLNGDLNLLGPAKSIHIQTSV